MIKKPAVYHSNSTARDFFRKRKQRDRAKNNVIVGSKSNFACDIWVKTLLQLIVFIRNVKMRKTSRPVVILEALERKRKNEF